MARKPCPEKCPVCGGQCRWTAGHVILDNTWHQCYVNVTHPWPKTED